MRLRYRGSAATVEAVDGRIREHMTEAASDRARDAEGAEPDWLESLDRIRQTYQMIGGQALFGAELSSIERGRTEFRLPISPLLGGGAAGGVHGGIMAALIDIAVVSAVRTLCVRGDIMRGTAELNISYLRPANGSALFISGTILRKGGSLAVGDAEIHDDAGRLVAKGRITYSLGRADA